MSQFLNSPSFVFAALFHLANGLALVSLLMRDQLHLRLVMAISLVLQGLYYFAIPGGPLFDPLFWKVFTSITNVAMIVLIFRDRFDVGVPNDLRALFSRIAVLSPGQFKRLVAPASRVNGPHKDLLVQGEMPSRMYYLIKGHAQVSKDGQRAKISPGAFLGEIAFLTQNPATASVSLDQDAECLSWTHGALSRIMGKEMPIEIAIRGLLNHDLARKVAESSLSGRPSKIGDNGVLQV